MLLRLTCEDNMRRWYVMWGNMELRRSCQLRSLLSQGDPLCAMASNRTALFLAKLLKYKKHILRNVFTYVYLLLQLGVMIYHISLTLVFCFVWFGLMHPLH